MNIKYYRLAKDEEPPEEFCAVRDIGGEPSEYVFYVPESEVAKLRKKADMLQWNSDCFIKIYGSWKRLRASVPHLERENAKLRRVIESEIHCMSGVCKGCVAYRPAEDGWCDQQVWLEELGIEGHL